MLPKPRYYADALVRKGGWLYAMRKALARFAAAPTPDEREYWDKVLGVLGYRPKPPKERARLPPLARAGELAARYGIETALRRAANNRSNARHTGAREREKYWAGVIYELERMRL